MLENERREAYISKAKSDFAKSVSNFIRNLDRLFNHAKEIGYLDDKSFIPLIGDIVKSVEFSVF